MTFAVRYGADAVYGAGKNFGMRAASENFSDEELVQAVKYCHERNVKFYVTVNILPHENELPALIEYLTFLENEAKPDALIVSDMGVFSLAKNMRRTSNCTFPLNPAPSIPKPASCMPP